MANLQVKDAAASTKYLKASGAGTDLDPHITEHLDTNSAAMLAALQAIQTAVELIDNMISGSEAQVDVVSSALPSGAATEATLAAIKTATEAIQASAELLDDMISGTEAQVDVVAPLPAGTNQIGDVVVNDIEDGAGTSVMDSVNHAVKVNVVAGSGSGVTHTDDAAFTAGTDDVVPAAGIYRTSPDAVDDGDAGALAMSSKRELFVQVRDAAGNDRGLNVDASGNLGVTDAGGALTVDGTVTADAGTGPWPVTDNDGSLTVDGTVTADAGTGPWPVTDNSGSLTVDQATHDNLQCNANLQIGDSDVGAGNPVPISDNGGALTVDGTVTADAGTGPWPVTDNSGSLTVDDGGTALEVQGDAANDAAVAGNPVLVGGYYNGSIGSGDEVDDGDAVRLLCDLIGGVVKGYHPGGWTANANYSTAQTDASVKAAPGAGLSLYVTDILFSTDTALNFFLESSSTTMVPKVYLAANGGWSAHFQTPIKWPANTAITITSSAAGNHSIMINGYTAP